MQAVVLSGGVGSRLWPLSNKSRPKPFITTDEGYNLVQKTFLRAGNISCVKGIVTVINSAFANQVKKDYQQINHLINENIVCHFILEPFCKNTAAAVAAAALKIQEDYGPDELMLILPTDHIISNKKAFEKAIGKAKDLASKGKLVTFGIKPSNPDISYGYIEFEDYQVKNFIEKPTFELAKQYLDKGNFYWNAGIFCFTAGSILQEMEKHSPIIFDQVKCSIDFTDSKNLTETNLDPSSFCHVPEESIDYAVMEKSDQIEMVPCDMGWKDIGTWKNFSNLSLADENGNRVKGNAILHDVSDCYIENNGHIVGAVGVKDLVIVSTKDGLLVTSKQNSEKVKNIYSQLQKDLTDIEKFSWGQIRIIHQNQGMQFKQIEVNPGSIVDISKYFRYASNWIIVRGKAKFYKKNWQTTLCVNESIFISLDRKIYLKNTEKDILIMITLQLDENTIIDFDEKRKIDHG